MTAYVKNLSLLDANDKRKEILSGLPNNDFIEFKSLNEEYFVYVFTDVDCGFCKNFIARFLNIII